MLFRSGRVALMNRGKLEEVNTPEGFIRALGAYAVDEVSEDGMESRFFQSREEAIAYLAQTKGRPALRDTTLEDVFVERAGRHLG